MAVIGKQLTEIYADQFPEKGRLLADRIPQLAGQILQLRDPLIAGIARGAVIAGGRKDGHGT